MEILLFLLLLSLSTQFGCGLIFFFFAYKFHNIYLTLSIWNKDEGKMTKMMKTKKWREEIKRVVVVNNNKGWWFCLMIIASGNRSDELPVFLFLSPDSAHLIDHRFVNKIKTIRNCLSSFVVCFCFCFLVQSKQINFAVAVQWSCFIWITDWLSNDDVIMKITKFRKYRNSIVIFEENFLLR